MIDTIPIYCVNLASSIQRKERMVARFTLHDLMKNVTFIEATRADDPILKYYLGKFNDPLIGKTCYGWSTPHGFNQANLDTGCYVSHLRAIKLFLDTNTTSPGCLVCEDDILLHNNFREEAEKLLTSIDDYLITFTYMLSAQPDKTLYGIHNNLLKIHPTQTWGTQCYYVPRIYAQEVIKKYDKPVDIVSNETGVDKVTSEIFVQKSNGYMAAQPIIIEDCIDSDRSPESIPYHMNFWARLDCENFATSDPNRLSPLINKK